MKPSLLDRVLAHLAGMHATRMYKRFRRAIDLLHVSQERSLRRALRVTAGSAFAREHKLDRVRSLADLRAAVPLRRYEDYRPWIERVAEGEIGALYQRRQRPLMFATSSGTTASPKLIPVTPDFVDDYRRGWNTFGMKMLADHPEAILRHILQVTGRMEEQRTASGIPVGAITGLLARTQKRIVRRYYVWREELTALTCPIERYYALMRLAVMKDLAFAITANPATLIRLAQIMDDHRESLVRDVRDGTLSATVVEGASVREAVGRVVAPDPARAAQLEQLINTHSVLRPRDVWNMSFLACWTGGSLGHYLQRLADWWGPLPVRDIGLLASEGRVSLPLDDGTPSGALDVTSGCFEFIPLEHAEDDQPETVGPDELEVGQEYAVVLSNPTGLLRYRLDDAVRVTGHVGPTPKIRFLHRVGRVSSVAGEKLTEHQVIEAVRATCATLGLPEFDVLAAPAWSDPPYYRVHHTLREAPSQLPAVLDEQLAAQNDEYAARRRSARLGPVMMQSLPTQALGAMDERLLAERRGTAEQYKRPVLLTGVDADSELLGESGAAGESAAGEAGSREAGFPSR